MTDTRHIVFVYGTLKTGEPNHGWFSKRTDTCYKFLGEAQTVERFPLIVATEFNIPLLLHCPGTGNRICGELYEVDETILSDLDVLEEVPDLYSRDAHRVICLGDQSEMTAWIYSIKNFKHELLDLPTITQYHSNGLYNGDYFSNSDFSHRKEIVEL